MARARFLHTADLHLSRPFGFLPPQLAEERRRDQRRTLARIADLALERDVDLLLVPGDVFDRPDPDPTDLEAVSENLRRLPDAGKPVFIAPGNHDYNSPTSFWRRFSIEGVRVWTGPDPQYEVLEDLGIAVAGAAFDKAGASRRAFDGLDIPSDVPCIILAHASYESFQGQLETYHPFSLADLARTHASYVALGHYHRLNTIVADGVTACYPGTPEGLGFDAPETGERYVVIGEVGEDGQVTLDPVQVNRRAMVSGEIDCSSFETQTSLEDAIRKLCDPTALVQIRLTGVPTRELALHIEEVASRFRESCFHLDIDLTGIRTPFDAGIDDRTIQGRFRAYMLNQIGSADDPERKRLLQRALELGLAGFAEE